MSRERGLFVPEGLLHTPGIPHREWRVLLLLLNHRNGTTGQCNPSHALLAEEMGVSRTAVKNALTWLRDAGIIDWKRAGRGSNWYFMDEIRWHEFGLSDSTNSGREDSTNSGHEPKKENRMNRTSPPSPADDAFPGMPDPEPKAPELRPPDAGHLVAAWCEGFTERRGKQPDESVLQRVRGTCKQVAKTRTDRDSWVTAWQAAKDAGRRGQYDVVAYLADYRPPARGNQMDVYAAAMLADTAIGPTADTGNTLTGNPYDPPKEIQ